ncbi:MAG TPA: arsinothricin resistance N-acetyltransferase ArsN1 family B [Gemmatimonadaceae bacterium]|nr:arsinothricin resistance N-acetyltransferase ArsN1 family B [Gemmatimonadaceae bacterium]
MPARIRAATEADAAQIAAIYAPVVATTAISFEYEPPSAHDMAARVRGALERYPWLVCERDGELLGYAYATRHRERAAYQWSAESSAYIRADARRRGVGRALYGALLPMLAAQGLRSVYAGVTLPNPASVGLHEAIGFRPVGVFRHVGYKFGAWHDVGWWQLALRGPEAPEPVRAFPQVVGTAEYLAAIEAGGRLLR